MHLNEGLLQAYLDGEASKEQTKIIERHLKECIYCQNKLDELKGLDDLISHTIETHKDELDNLPFDIDAAYQRFEMKIRRNKWKGLKHKMAKYKKLVGGLAAILIFAITLFVPPVRQAAADFLHIFRVQNLATVQMNIEDLDKMCDDFAKKVGEIDLAQLGKANVKSQAKNEMVNLAQAQEKVPFTIKYPMDFNLNDNVMVSDELNVEFTLNVNEVNKILKQLGSKKLLPSELNGKPFSVYSAGQVEMHLRLGENYSPKDLTMIIDGKEFTAEQANMKVELGRKNWINFYQMASPEITVPDGVDVSELREVLLDIPVIPYEIKNKLEKIQDWQHTLVVPTDSDSKIVNIDGTKAILQKSDYHNSLLWVKDGAIYNLSASSKIDLVKLAKSLRDV